MKKVLYLIAFISLVFVSCSNMFDSNRCEKGHPFDEEWSWNDEKHWHKALCFHKDNVKDFGEHEWGPEVIVISPLEASYSLSQKTCKVCGKVVFLSTTEKIPHTHRFSSDWSNDDEYHFKRAICTHSEEVSEKSKHEWGKGTITKFKYVEDPETGKEKEMPDKVLFSCTVCSYSKEFSYEEVEHVHWYEEYFSKDEDYHFKAARCEHSEEVDEKSPHKWGDYYIANHKNYTVMDSDTTDAIYLSIPDEVGTRCTVCDLKKYIPYNESELFYENPDKYFYSQNYHYKINEYGQPEEIKELGEHTYRILNFLNYEYEGTQIYDPDIMEVSPDFVPEWVLLECKICSYKDSVLYKEKMELINNILKQDK
ncbi:MAG: hypothetical protein MJ160_03660 [Treponema sp.]|nr:hypothetical protein [Treponema sp.]